MTSENETKKEGVSSEDAGCEQAHEHAWKGTWKRPLKVDERSLDPLTVARMTDHNVRASDEEEATPEELGEKKKPA